VASEDESEALLDPSIGEEFSESEYSDHGGRQGERRREETTVQFPAEEEEISKGGTCINGGIIYVGKSQNGMLEPRKEGIINVEKEEARNNLLVDINSGGGTRDVSGRHGGEAGGEERVATLTATLDAVEKVGNVSPLPRSKADGAGTRFTASGALSETETMMSGGEGVRAALESQATTIEAYVGAGSHAFAPRLCVATDGASKRSRWGDDTKGRGDAKANCDCEVGGAWQIDEEEGEVRRIDYASKGTIVCEIDDETTNATEKMSTMGLVRSVKVADVDDRAVVVFTPKNKACRMETISASCPVGRLMDNIGGGGGDMSVLRDGNPPLVERLSKSVSLKGLRSEITISVRDVRIYRKMVRLKDEQGEIRRA